MTRNDLTEAQRLWLSNVAQAAQRGRYYALEQFQKPILAATCIAQAIRDSEWGTDRLAHEANNHFRIKAGGAWRGDAVVMRTHEFINGTRQLTSAAFRKYPSLDACVQDYARLVATSGYYRRAVDVLARGLTAGSIPTWEYYTRSLGEVWSTDPSYVSDIVALLQDLELLDFDTPT